MVELQVARTKDANRSILERLSREKKTNKKVNKNIASPEKRRSIVEEAAKTSVIPRSLSSVIDVTTRALRPNVKPVKRVCRVSSFVGREDDEVPQNVIDGNSDAQEQKQEATDEDRDNQLKENDKVNLLQKAIASLRSLCKMTVLIALQRTFVFKLLCRLAEKKYTFT